MLQNEMTLQEQLYDYNTIKKIHNAQAKKYLPVTEF